jgi:hypothetical protein
MAEQAGYHLMVRIKGPGRPSRIEDLLRDEYTIGRGDRASGLRVDFEVPEDGYLSRVHCKLRRDEETYSVENASPNGTKVNGKLVEQTRKLKHRDRIDIGEGTTVEFLALTDEERARELAAESEGGAPRGKGEKRPLTRRPIFWGVIVFYGILVLVLLSASGGDEAVVADPGGGPYFAWMLRAPLLYDQRPDVQAQRTEFMWKDVPGLERVPPEERRRITKQVWEEAQMRAQIPDTQRVAHAKEMWATAVVAHGGEGRGQGGNDYRLVREAMHVLGFMDHSNLKAAADAGDAVATEALAALQSLEERAKALLLEADRFLRSGHRALAAERYAQLLRAVPDKYEHVHRFAAWRLGRLQRK